MQALHFGAGNIGKGLIGNLLSKTGYHVCFVDVNQKVVDQINQNNWYHIEILDDHQTIETISPVSALNSLTQEDQVVDAIVNADIITTSVGVNNLSKIAKILAKGLIKRAECKKKVDVIANENTINASDVLKREIQQTVSREEMDLIDLYVGFPNSAIDRTSLMKHEAEGTVLVEPYFEWIIDQSEMVQSKLPLIKHVIYVQNLRPYIERKLYLVNMGHAAIAYLGHLAGEPTIQSALNHSKIEKVVRDAMVETSRYIIHAYHLNSSEITRFIDKTIQRFKNENIQDDVLRVGRSPIRKLGYDERLVKPTVELFRLGLPIKNLTIAIAAAFRFNHSKDDESVQLQKYIYENGIDQAITHFTKIKEPNIKDQIRKNYTRLSNEFQKEGPHVK